jgi:uncharacterized protein YlxW (UPF0749 family)
MKKLLGVCIAIAIVFSTVAFTPSGGAKKKDTEDLQQQVSELKVHVADLNARVTKLEKALADMSRESSGKGGFKAD